MNALSRSNIRKFNEEPGQVEELKEEARSPDGNEMFSTPQKKKANHNSCPIISNQLQSRSAKLSGGSLNIRKPFTLLDPESRLSSLINGMNIESIKEVEESKLEESRMVSRERKRSRSRKSLGLYDSSSDHESISDGDSPEPKRK